VEQRHPLPHHGTSGRTRLRSQLAAAAATGRYGRPGGPKASSGDDTGISEILATINVEGDNPLADFIRENAETEVTKAEEKRRRLLQRQNIGSGG